MKCGVRFRRLKHASRRYHCGGMESCFLGYVLVVVICRLYYGEMWWCAVVRFGVLQYSAHIVWHNMRAIV